MAGKDVFSSLPNQDLLMVFERFTDICDHGLETIVVHSADKQALAAIAARSTEAVWKLQKVRDHVGHGGA